MAQDYIAEKEGVSKKAEADEMAGKVCRAAYLLDIRPACSFAPSH